MVIDALYESSYEFLGEESSHDFEVNEERSACGYLVAIEDAVRKVCGCSEVLFSSSASKGRLWFSPKGLGRIVFNLIWREEFIRKFYPLHEFSPYVEVFFKASSDFRKNHNHPGVSGYFRGEIDGVVASLNEMIDEVRRIVYSASFKAEINRHTRSSNKNYRSVVRYIDALFKARSRLLVVRLDLGYGKENRSLASGGEISYAEVRSHREKFFRELRKIFRKGELVGFCWKLEYGLSKSYHYHVMIFLDGSKRREDISLGRVMGEVWRENVTSGKGVYFNCNAKKGSYRYCGIGMVNHDDAGMRESLLKAAAYLTKLEFYIKIALEGRARSFGRGEMPDLSKVGRGRPRRGL